MNKNKPSSSSAKDVFSYLLMIVMLYVGVISFITLLWQYINVQFPDFLDFYYSGSLDLIRGSISALLVSWPVFLFLQWLIGKDLKSNSHKAQVWIRKWMLHLTIFVAAITIIIDLINLLNDFLGGELTLRTGLKLLVILLVAVGVFGYELWELRRDVKEKTRIPVISAILSSALILSWVIAGFFIVGTPNTQREIRMDEERISDLEIIQYQILSYWQVNGEIPAELDELEDPITGFIVPTDPYTNQDYDYIVTGDLTFDLCATFDRDYDPLRSTTRIDIPGYSQKEDATNFWQYSTGSTCFSRELDPDYQDIKASEVEFIRY